MTPNKVDVIRPLAPERLHRIVTTREPLTTRHYCLECSAHSAGSTPPQPPCAGPTAEVAR